MNLILQFVPAKFFYFDLLIAQGHNLKVLLIFNPRKFK